MTLLVSTTQTYSCHMAAGRDATDLPSKERQIGFVFQSYALFKHMTLAENISFGPRMQEMDIDIDRR